MATINITKICEEFFNSQEFLNKVPGFYSQVTKKVGDGHAISRIRYESEIEFTQTLFRKYFICNNSIHNKLGAHFNI